MMGRPGSGKGTQGKLLAKALGADIYSSGNRLREMAKSPGFVNEKIKKTMEEGLLLPAWFSSHLFVEALLSIGPEEKIVFEGACRRLEEAEAFDETAGWLERDYRALFLNVTDDIVEQRINQRKGVEGRKDDASDTVEHRMKEYNEHTAFAVEFLRTKGKLIEIDANHEVEEVNEAVLKAAGL